MGKAKQRFGTLKFFLEAWKGITYVAAGLLLLAGIVCMAFGQLGMGAGVVMLGVLMTIAQLVAIELAWVFLGIEVNTSAILDLLTSSPLLDSESAPQKERVKKND